MNRNAKLAPVRSVRRAEDRAPPWARLLAPGTTLYRGAVLVRARHSRPVTGQLGRSRPFDVGCSASPVSRSFKAPARVVPVLLVTAQTRWRQCETYLSTQCPQAGETARIPPPHVDAFGSHDSQEPSPAWPGTAVSLIERVTDRGSFVALRHPEQRVRRGVLRIAFISDETGRRRCAYALPRRVGNAVVRNRIRRRLRQVFATIEREQASGASPFPSGTYLVSATSMAAEVPFADLLDTARSLLRELDRRGASR